MSDRLNRKVAALAKKFYMDPPRVKIVSGKPRDPFTVHYGSKTVYIPDQAANELTDNELDFAICLALVRSTKMQVLSSLIKALPLVLMSGIGFLIVFFNADYFVRNIGGAFGILIFFSVLGLIGSMMLRPKVNRVARAEIFAEALLATGNAGAAETYLVRRATDYIVSGTERMSGEGSRELDSELMSLRDAASRLGLKFSSVGFFS